jgi:leucyl/phenylalanyl-tRNA--protein transferase
MHDPFSAELVLRGYCAGMFPMADHAGRIRWFSPDPRCIFEYDKFRVSHTLRQTVRQGRFEIRTNTAFDDVIAACGRPGEATWISPRIQRVYCELHRAGFAHSVEAWRGGALAGGLYGVAIGGAFFGESMFHHQRDASKVAMVALMERLQTRGFTLVDTQWSTPHLARLGAVEIPRDEYLRRLAAAIELPVTFA